MPFVLNEYFPGFAYNEARATTTRTHIALDPTDQRIVARPAAAPQDAEASLRSDLAAQLANASSELQNQLAALRASAQHGGSHALAEAQATLEGLAQLQRQVSHADIRSLVSLRSEVGAVIAVSTAIGQQASGSASALTNGRTLQEARDEARSTTDRFMRDYFENRKFDQYLQFASREDEDRYRRREEERLREIEKARAKGTPEGDLRAAKLALEQLKDAGAHGADRSPELQKMLGSMNQSVATLEKCITEGKGREASNAHSNEIENVPAKAVSADVLAGLKSLTLSDPESIGHGIPDRAVKSSQGRAT